jgi:acyl-CoA synthetase (AMP-forming)/AMP-acid ligase II
MLERVGRNYAGKLAYRCGIATRTWSQMNDRAGLLGGGLLSLGLVRGDTVAILGQETLEIYEHYFACMKTGLVRVGVNWRYAPAEVAHILKDCAVKAVLVEARCVPLLRAALDFADLPQPVVIGYGADHGQELDYETLLRRSVIPAPGPLLDSDPLVVSYTSGSTGVPKGVVHSHRSVALIIIQGAVSRGLTTDDIWYGAIASSWMACVLNMIGLANGMTTIVMDGAFDADTFIEDTQRHGISAALLVPTLIGRVMDRCCDRPSVLASLRLLMYGSSPASVNLLERVLGTFECRLMQTYGMTEGGWVSHLTPRDHDLGLKGRPELLRSAGRVGGMYEISVRDDQGRALPAGEHGEFWLRGETTMLGYLNLPRETDEALADGWLRTNDIGRFDEEGYLYLVDRKKFLIITGAVNVFPAGVEAVLGRHPDIAEISVVGAPHPEWGEAVVAVVATRPGRPLPTVAALAEFAKGHLSRVELPKHVLAIDELPRTVTSKIDKPAVKDWVMARQVSLPWVRDAALAQQEG